MWRYYHSGNPDGIVWVTENPKTAILVIFVQKDLGNIVEPLYDDMSAAKDRLYLVDSVVVQHVNLFHSMQGSIYGVIFSTFPSS